MYGFSDVWKFSSKLHNIGITLREWVVRSFCFLKIYFAFRNGVLTPARGNGSAGLGVISACIQKMVVTSLMWRAAPCLLAALLLALLSPFPLNRPFWFPLYHSFFSSSHSPSLYPLPRFRHLSVQQNSRGFPIDVISSLPTFLDQFLNSLVPLQTASLNAIVKPIFF